ncbi:MAG: 4-(cytidine 5'-diphospho)-2-C-methyl-D-erythritol kinase [Gammaproteobacteria bacterium]|nr:4-(cytidine 5'-diphospho)-2-C-methyl-D-erythritol kinase [Gammaproteobacteria bacterium]MDE2251865.1 4-(cytidine 5'-diphospho)-2-C-methyl-D-erythritol kinase [Gammaproteobacteria bacterium]
MCPRWWPAPAKLNLFLHVLGRREDGFHDLQTLFQLLDWGDEIHVEVTADPRIERVAGPASIAPESDLVVRAALALQRATGVERGARLRVRKRIPTGGGLGGGSSDAATVLRVLNRLWGTNLEPGQLGRIGLALGSDVPVFLAGSSAWAEGRGERLTPVELPDTWYLIVHPGVAVATAGIFQAPELTRNSRLVTMRGFSPAEGGNDCEAVVRARYPEVAAALEWLGRRARLSGTGSCVFAPFGAAAEAERVAARVPDEWASFVARGVNRSPLDAALAIIA